MPNGTYITPAVVTGTTSWQQLGAPAANGKVRSYTIRATNISNATAYAHVRISNGVVQGRRATNYPVPYLDLTSAPDLEQNLVLPAGWYPEGMASANSVIEYTCTMVEDDA